MLTRRKGRFQGRFRFLSRRGFTAAVQPNEREFVKSIDYTDLSLDVLDRLESFWYSEWPQVSHRPIAATEEQIQAFEELNHIKLPANLRRYFLRLNGTDGNGDDRMYRFWPISEIAPVAKELKRFDLPEADRYFLFADFMIESYYFAIYLGNNPSLQNQIVVPDSFGKYPVAFDFSHFLELYLRDDPKLYSL